METSSEKFKSKFSNFQQFWPFYLSQHRNRMNRFMHLAGASTGLTLGFFLALQDQLLYAVIVMLVAGYGLSWIGHFFFEKNRPATFKYPIYSFFADIKMVTCLILRKNLKP